MAVDEFKGVPSAAIKKQLRDIRHLIYETEIEGWYIDEWDGEEKLSLSAEYLLMDLQERERKLHSELAKRYCPPEPEPRCPYCGSDLVTASWVHDLHKVSNDQPDHYSCANCGNHWEE